LGRERGDDQELKKGGEEGGAGGGKEKQGSRPFRGESSGHVGKCSKRSSLYSLCY